jgi:glutaredoxin
MARVTVTMYTLSTCPWCKMTKKFFADHHVQYEYTDYDLADEKTQARIMDEFHAAGASGFPFVRIGEKVVVGYQPDVYAKLISV